MNNNIKHNMRRDIYNIMWNRKLDKKNIYITWVLILISNVIFLYQPVITSNIYKSIEIKDINNIYMYVFLWIGLLAIAIATDLVRKVILEWIEYKINHEKYKIYMNKLSDKDINLITDGWSWKIQNIFSQWVEAEWNIFRDTVWLIWLIVIRWWVCIMILWIINIYIIPMIAWLIIVMYFMQKHFSKVQTEIYDKINIINQQSSRLTIRFISEMLLVKINNKQKSEAESFSENYKPIIKLWKSSTFYGDIFYEIFWLFVESIIFIIMLYFGIKVIWWEWNISDIIKIIWYIYLVRWPIQAMLTNISSLNRMVSKYHELQSFLNTPNKIINGKTQYIYKSWNINLQNVNFWYNEDRKILENMNMNFPSGKTTALVWHSWSGKSTIIKLLLRLYDTDNGHIYIDNQNICDLDISTLYNHVWYLTQEPAIFDGTIRENLMYGLYDDIQKTETGRDVQLEHVKTDNNQSENSSNIYNSKNNIENKYSLTSEEIEERLRNWLKLAKADELVAWLKDGLDTEIGEKWIKLSWWERQRIAIARIFVKNPSILILDEPTSALDSISEHAITEAINTLMCNKTVIIIAHRLQTVMHADNIFIIYL